MKLKTNLTCALLLLLCAFTVAHADKLDDYVAAEMQRRHVPGATVAVVRDGKVIRSRGYGLANVELNVPATEHTVFEIGSITKQFTASAIMLLVEEGKINLDDPVAKYLDGLPSDWSGITVRHLLTHTSGIRTYFGLKGFELRNHLTREEFIKNISQIKLSFRPGEQYLYSNTGYHMLGLIVEKASGEPYWQFLGERIFKPLGMSETGDRNPLKLVKNRADGYEWENGEWVNRDYDLTDVFSAGAIVSTVLDLAKWDAALYTEKILKRASLNQMWTPLKFNNGTTYPYGLGWDVNQFRGQRLISHGGQTAGFSANISRYVDERLTVIVLTNNGANGIASRIARGVAKFYIPTISLRALKAGVETDAARTQKLKEALQNRLAGKLDAAIFTASAIKALSGAEARDEATRLAQSGPVTSFVFISNDAEGKNHVLRYRVEIGQEFLLFRFNLTEDGYIAAMNLEEEEMK